MGECCHVQVGYRPAQVSLHLPLLEVGIMSTVGVASGRQGDGHILLQQKSYGKGAETAERPAISYEST